MKPIFEFLDYRTFLREFYEDKKSRQPFFSYRFFGRKVGVDGSYLAKVLTGKRHIADDSIKSFSDGCGLDEKEAEYFETLVHFAKSKSEKEGKFHLERLLAFKVAGSQSLLPDQFDYFRTWYHSAVRSILEYFDFRGDYNLLALMLNPPITPKEAEASIALLLNLGLIKVDGNGRYRMTEAALSTGPNWKTIAIDAFQEQTLRLSIDSIKRDPEDQRDFSTLTMNINAQDFLELRERVQEFREALINYVNKSAGPNRTYQLNIQLFPLSKIETDKMVP